MHVTNGIPLGRPLPLTVAPVNCVQTLKVRTLHGGQTSLRYLGLVTLTLTLTLTHPPNGGQTRSHCLGLIPVLLINVAK
jgi:hypothetical protein